MSEQHTVCRNCGADVSGAKFCPECGAAVQDIAAEQTLQMDGPAPRRMPPAPGQVSAPQGQASDAAKTFRLRIVVGVALVLAIAGLGLGLAGFLQARSTHSQDARLRSELAAARQQLKTTQTAISTLREHSQSGAVTTLTGQMNKLTVCIPQLQQEINGLNVSTQWQSIGGTTYLTGATLSNPTITSSNCNKVLTSGP